MTKLWGETAVEEINGDKHCRSFRIGWDGDKVIYKDAHSLIAVLSLWKPESICHCIYPDRHFTAIRYVMMPDDAGANIVLSSNYGDVRIGLHGRRVCSVELTAKSTSGHCMKRLQHVFLRWLIEQRPTTDWRKNGELFHFTFLHNFFVQNLYWEGDNPCPNVLGGVYGVVYPV